MASLDSRDPRFLTNNQQDLLRAALASNKPQQASSTEPATVSMPAIEGVSGAAPSFDDVDTFGAFDPEDPLLASFYEGDTSFDISGTEIADVFPGDLEVKDIHDKRKMSESSPDPDEIDSKRREGDEKQAKKPGRKPLTTEPTTKRKAQNRAAQRAFRERKEAHLKDLETKVDDLTKASEAEKQENGILRAQVERLQSELKEYRNRLSTDSSRTPASYKPTNRSDFIFNFPNFGVAKTNGTISQVPVPGQTAYIKRESGDAAAASSNMPPLTTEFSNGSNSTSPYTGNTPDSRHASASMQSFAGLFSNDILNEAAAASNSPEYGIGRNSQSPVTRPLRENSATSNGAAERLFRFNSESVRSSTESPSQSSMSQFNASSSCNTSPAPSQHPSPPKDSAPNTNPGLTTISEMGTTNSHPTPSTTTNSIDWLAMQNGGQFDPVLFGDYRESQEAVIGDGDFNNGFFNDAFPFDFASPLNFADTISPKPTNMSINQAQQNKSQNVEKPSQTLMAEIENTQAGGDDNYGLPGTNNPTAAPATITGGKCPKSGQMMSANAIWNQLQSNKDFLDGNFDLDGLCSELRSKAKCSQSGMAVDSKDVLETFKSFSSKSAVPEDIREEQHGMIFDEAFVNKALKKLSKPVGAAGGAATTTTQQVPKMQASDSWGGFGLTDEQLNQGW